MSIRSRRLALVIALATLVAAALPGAVSANHAWGGYHWARTANPFTLKLGDNVNSTWDSFLVTTSSDWTASSVLNTTIVTGGARPKNCRPTSGRVEVCNAAYGSNGWLGVAQIWVSGGVHITQGTVKVNDSYFKSAPYNTAAWRNLVMCQEVGHTLGLDHQDENFNNANLNTCMDYTNNPSTNQHPNAHDYEMLESIYAHLDSTSTAGSAAAGSSAAPGSWGQLVATEAGGRASVYRLDLADGSFVLTHVFWA